MKGYNMNADNIENRVMSFCVKHSNYKVYKAMTGRDSLACLVAFTMKNNASVIAANINKRNCLV